MANRTLSPEERAQANTLLGQIRASIEALSAGDPELKFAYRRKVFKELAYDERSKPMARRSLKAKKRLEQNGLCAICQKPLPDKYAVLDRFKAADGYTVVNTRLIHADCDTMVQVERGYA